MPAVSTLSVESVDLLHLRSVASVGESNIGRLAVGL